MALMQCLAIDILVTKFRFSRKNALTLKKKVLATYLYWTGKAKVDRWTLFPTKRRGYLISSSKNIFFLKKTKNINILSVGLKLEGATCSSPQRRTWSSAFDFTLTPPVEKLLLFRGSAARGRIGTAFITFLVLEKNHLVPPKLKYRLFAAGGKRPTGSASGCMGEKKRISNWKLIEF